MKYDKWSTRVRLFNIFLSLTSAAKYKIQVHISYELAWGRWLSEKK